MRLLHKGSIFPFCSSNEEGRGVDRAHTHTHAHRHIHTGTQREREKDREKEIERDTR